MEKNLTDFNGFTLPESAWLPPEMIDLLPELSKSELKILIVILYNHTQIGDNSPTSIRDLEYITGLSRQSAFTAVKQLLEAELIVRFKTGQSFIYEARVQKLGHQVKLSKSDESNNDSTLLDSTKLNLLKTLRSCGVYGKTARKVVDEFDIEYIQTHVDFYEFAIRKGWAHGPGWLINSIKENWDAPIDYKTTDAVRTRQRYAEWEK